MMLEWNAQQVSLCVFSVYIIQNYMHVHAYSHSVSKLLSSNCLNGDVRLVDGSNELEGRVEMCYDQRWGTVCHNRWDTMLMLMLSAGS